MPNPTEPFSAKAFLLTGESQDSSGSNQICFYGHSPETGPVEILIQNNKPLFFIERSASLPPLPAPFERAQVALKSFSRQDVDALYFTTQKDLFQARDILRQNGTATFESDIYPSDRFLMERFIQSQVKIQGIPQKIGNLTRFVNPRLSPAFVSPKFKIASLDIETGIHTDELYSIAVHLTGPEFEDKKIFMLDTSLSLRATEGSEAISKTASSASPPRHVGQHPQDTAGIAPKHKLWGNDDPTLSFYPSERSLLKGFLKWFQDADPDILLGWNVVNFDLSFLDNKCRAFGIRFEIGRNKRPCMIKKRSTGGLYAVLPGRVIFDGPVALRSSFYSFEDFTLETVSQELLGEGKLIGPDTQRGHEIERLFREDKTALAEYNLQDCVLVTRIFEKTGLLDLYVKRAQISGLLLDQVGMSTAAFDHFYLPRLHRRGFVAANVADIELLEHAAGGYVISPRSGLYDHVLALDFKSLYPTIIRTFSIDPLSRLLAESDPEPVSTPKGIRFSRKEAILPEFIGELMELRAQAAAKKDGHLSQAIKILMNSLYGVMGSAGSRFYHPDLPTAITSTGQWLLIGSKAFLEARRYEVLYGDTDSLFVKCSAEKLGDPDVHGKKLADDLTAHWKQELLKQFGVTSYLEVKYEKYYRKYLLPLARTGEGGAKKRYSGLRVSGSKESLEFVGMEYVRSDWTKLAKEFQEGLYRRVFHDENPDVWMRQFVQDVRDGKMNDKLVYRKRLRKRIEDYTKNIPPQVKAALQLENPGREIRYLMTARGPVPESLKPKDIDFVHYINKQLRPIADSLLGLSGKSFDAITRPLQFSLFDEAPLGL